MKKCDSFFKNENSLIDALHEVQREFDGEASRVGLKDESDVVSFIKDIRNIREYREISGNIREYRGISGNRMLASMFRRQVDIDKNAECGHRGEAARAW